MLLMSLLFPLFLLSKIRQLEVVANKELSAILYKMGDFLPLALMPRGRKYRVGESAVGRSYKKEDVGFLWLQSGRDIMQRTVSGIMCALEKGKDLL